MRTIEAWRGVSVEGSVSVQDELHTRVVATADAALHAAKEAGRNRVFGPDGAWAQAA